MQFIALNTNSFWVQNKLKSGFGWSTGLGVRRLIFPLQGAPDLLHKLTGVSLPAQSCSSAWVSLCWALQCQNDTMFLQTSPHGFGRGRSPHSQHLSPSSARGLCLRQGWWRLYCWWSPIQDPQPSLGQLSQRRGEASGRTWQYLRWLQLHLLKLIFKNHQQGHQKWQSQHSIPHQPAGCRSLQTRVWKTFKILRNGCSYFQSIFLKMVLKPDEAVSHIKFNQHQVLQGLSTFQKLTPIHSPLLCVLSESVMWCHKHSPPWGYPGPFCAVL